MQPNNQNPYDFILDSSQKPTGPAMLQDPKKRMVVAVLFVVGVLLLVVIAVSVVLSLGKKNTSAISDVAAYQTELFRISTLGLKGAVDPAVKADITTLNGFVQSDLTQTVAFLGSTGKELTEVESAAKLDQTVDKDLESAELRNSFDEALQSAIEKTSTAYKIALKKALDSASSDKEKAMLDTAASNILTYEGL